MSESELIRLEKRLSVIDKLKRKHGFLGYFFDHFKKWSPVLECQLEQWKSITVREEKDRWRILNTHSLVFLLDKEDHLYFNIHENQFESLTEDFPNEHKHLTQSIMEVGFETYFIQHFCCAISFETISSFINITKEEYKSSWILDRNKQMIYFKFRNLCGEGSVKKTFLGWNVLQESPIVVYQIHTPPNVMEQKRCINEQRIARMYRSPFLLNIHYWYTHRENQKVFMIADFMKYSVKTMIDINYPWSLSELKLFATHILTALNILHSIKVIHRDIKPSNILFDNDKNFYCLIDFGVSTKYNIVSNRVETIGVQSEHLSLVGTVGYIAPEMYKSIYTLLDDLPYTFAVDIFSFGITLLEMISKKRAFELDLVELSEYIDSDLQYYTYRLTDQIDQEIMFLRNMSQEIMSDPTIKKDDRFKTFKAELDNKIQLLDQLLSSDSEDRDFYISELLDCNKSISLLCKRFKSNHCFSRLNKQTSTIHTFMSEIKSLEQFASKIELYRKKPKDEIVQDLLVYPILFNSVRYQFPKSISEIQDSLLQDFLQKCLCKDPEERWSASQLLQHPWLLYLEDDR